VKIADVDLHIVVVICYRLSTVCPAGRNRTLHWAVEIFTHVTFNAKDAMIRKI